MEMSFDYTVVTASNKKFVKITKFSFLCETQHHAKYLANKALSKWEHEPTKTVKQRFLASIEQSSSITLICNIHVAYYDPGDPET